MRSREISALIDEVVAAAGAELVDFRSVGSRHNPLLRAYVDVPGGTTAKACAELSRRIEARLDGSGLAGERYTLEVSSPGLDRPLLTRRDFARLLGRPVAVQVGSGGGEFVGLLEDVGGEDEDFWIVLRVEGRQETMRLGGDQIASARPHVPW